MMTPPSTILLRCYRALAALALFLPLFVALPSCDGDDGGPGMTAPVASVEVTPASSTLTSLGEQLQLSATARDAGGTAISGKPFTWSSSDESVATVSASGLVTPEAVGDATITATTDGVDGTADVSVMTNEIRVRPEGGTVTAAGGQVELVFPAGAVDAATIITVEAAASPPPSIRLVTGTAFDLGPTGTQFNDPVRLTVSYDPADLPITVEEEALGLFRAGATTWERVPGSSVDVGARTVTAEIDGFSTFAVRGGPSQAPPILALGDVRTCAILAGGLAWCWGENNAGVFGNGTQDDADNIPVPGAQGLVLRWLTLAGSGNDFACGITTEGEAYCWGENGNGELGAPSSETCPFDVSCSTTPLRVSDPASGPVTWQVLSVNGENGHSCGISENGTTYCWGANNSGQLGDGTQMNRTIPTPVQGGLVFEALTAGEDFVCALDSQGSAYCWGQGSEGALGNGSEENVSVPTAVSTTETFVGISAGRQHACALTADGEAYCWGGNNNGQLGAPTSETCAFGVPCSTTPLAVAGGLTFRWIATGFQMTCGITTADAAYCWGEGDEGQLGNGTVGNQATPTLVAGGLMFRSVVPEEHHGCGVTTGGEIYCWGSGSAGQIGDGVPGGPLRLTPVRVIFP